ncbi:unnamed protein product [Prorocentrum cordatum]|nr:unnamed protein product [Polarella glacialis]
MVAARSSQFQSELQEQDRGNRAQEAANRRIQASNSDLEAENHALERRARALVNSNKQLRRELKGLDLQLHTAQSLAAAVDAFTAKDDTAHKNGDEDYGDGLDLKMARACPSAAGNMLAFVWQLSVYTFCFRNNATSVANTNPVEACVQVTQLMVSLSTQTDNAGQDPWTASAQWWSGWTPDGWRAAGSWQWVPTAGASQAADPAATAGAGALATGETDVADAWQGWRDRGAKATGGKTYVEQEIVEEVLPPPSPWVSDVDVSSKSDRLAGEKKESVAAATKGSSSWSGYAFMSAEDDPTFLENVQLTKLEMTADCVESVTADTCAAGLASDPVDWRSTGTWATFSIEELVGLVSGKTSFGHLMIKKLGKKKMQRKPRTLGSIVESDTDMSGSEWEALPETIEAALEADAMTQQEEIEFHSGQLNLAKYQYKWRHWFLRLTCVDLVLKTMKAMVQRLPKSFTESFPSEMCEHPPWARKQGSNPTSVYEHCRQCAQRLWCRDKTAEELFDAQRRKHEKATAKVQRAEAKEKAAQMLKDYKNGRFEALPPDPWTPGPEPQGARRVVSGSGSTAVISAAGVPPCPQNLLVPIAEGYVPYKHPPPVKQEGAPPSAAAGATPKPPGPSASRPMSVTEMQTALSDMKICIDTQARSNERIWERVREFVNSERAARDAQPPPTFTDEDLARLASMMMRIQSIQGAGSASGSQGP